ncbi:MAG: ComEC/Rec2 family competence protein [Mangrovibacterium sp.]
MHLLRDNPIIKLLQFWLIGILCARYFPEATGLRIFMVFVLGLLALSVRKLHRFDFNTKNLFSTWSIATLFVLLSAFNYQWQLPEQVPDSTQAEQVLLLQLEEPLTENKNSKQAVFQICKAEDDSLVSSKLLAFLPKETPDTVFQFGYHYLMSVKLSRLVNQKAPYAFDYAGYMAKKGIHYRCYIPTLIYDVIQQEHKIIRHQLAAFRHDLLGIYSAHLSAESSSLVSALALGYRADLTTEQKTYFRDAGIMHILAVSGLHVGIVCGLILFLLKPLSRKQKWLWLYALLVFSGIWFYALLMGSSSSVLRAAFMFSVLIVGRLLHRDGAIYSSIALSALVLLVVNPNLLFDVGFQLSYAAVIAIVFLHPSFARIYAPRTKLGGWFWGIITISLAVQLGTAPLSLYYFHQFPSYFLVSNLVAIPAATIILGLSLFALFLSPWQTLATPFFVVLDWLVHLFLQIFQWMSSWAYAAIKNIYLSEFGLALLVVSVLTFMAGVWCNKRRYLKLSCLLLLFAIAENAYDRFSRRNDVYVFRYDQEGVVQLIKGSSHYIIYNDSVPPLLYVYQATIVPLRLNAPVLLHSSAIDSFRDEQLLIRNKVVQLGDSVFVLE